MSLPCERPEPAVEILLVEDSPTQAARLRRLMEVHGYRTRVASNGRQALQALAERKPALVLSDVVMPEMNGYELCRSIKSEPSLCDTPVILITSLTDPKDIVSGLECGADNFVRKPYADEYLLKRIEHVLINQHLRRADAQRMELGIMVYLGGQKHFINAERQQILDLLISTYEQAVSVNEELQAREMQISELNAKLARRAGELEQINAEIARKNLELQRASGMKSEFVANMSHELRTPLNAIMGYSEMLKDGLLGELVERQNSAAGAIFDAGMHLLSLINDILDLSRIEAGRMELDLEMVDVEELLANSMTMLSARAMAHRIEVKLDEREVEPLLLDRRKARQIVYNLLSNAVKFTPDGGTVTLHARRVSEPQTEDMPPGVEMPPCANGWLEIAVVDNGIGIAPSDMSRLFQPFSQLDSGPKRKYEGSGLGLALVKQLVQLHGGMVTVDSRVGRGTTFKVWLPYRDPTGAGVAPVGR